MKKFTLVLSSLFLAALVHAQAPVSPVAQAAPVPAVEMAKVLEFKEATHDFGKIAMGKPVEFDVFIKNIGSDSIKVENVKVGCGCTTPRYEQVAHAPGSTFKVTLGFSNMQEGHFEKYADIFFNNGLSKQVKFFGEGYKVADNSAPANGAVQKIKSINQ